MKHGDAESIVDGPIAPCLKWPGGKQWLAPALAPVLTSELSNRYFEPFLGAGALYFYMAPQRAHLADTNRNLIQFFQVLARTPHAVIEKVWGWSNTPDCYYRVRRLSPRSAVSAAARFLYLNRTCWGGIYRTNRSGDFNVPFGNSGRVICRKHQVLACAGLVGRAEVSALDFAELMSSAETGDVVYADPPYTTKGQNNGFLRYNEQIFSWEDQCRLAESAKAASKRGAFIAISGLWHRDIFRLYPGWWAWGHVRGSQVSCRLEGRGTVHEVVLLSRRPKGFETSDGRLDIVQIAKAGRT